ncbi:MAG: hypothetical protein GQ564_13060 [Bacteroidales bacterium]|nr:hypothetical protein [Bacteroidales bacterium]
MKKKSLNKKLVLKKGIISNLNLSKVKGGEYEPYTLDVCAWTWGPICDID